MPLLLTALHVYASAARVDDLDTNLLGEFPDSVNDQHSSSMLVLIVRDLANLLRVVSAIARDAVTLSVQLNRQPTDKLARIIPAMRQAKNNKG